MIYPDETMLYAPVEWHDCSEGYTDILYEKSTDGIAKITINRPQVRNAFRPVTVKEMIQALADARYDDNIGVIILTGAGDKAFCAGGDQKVRGDYGGYQDDSGVHHLNVLDFQRQIRTCPKPVVAMVAGFSIGGGHVLHRAEHPARAQGDVRAVLLRCPGLRRRPRRQALRARSLRRRGQ